MERTKLDNLIGWLVDVNEEMRADTTLPVPLSDINEMGSHFGISSADAADILRVFTIHGIITRMKEGRKTLYKAKVVE